MKNYYYIIIVVLIALSFFAGRCTINTKPKVEYIKGETIHDSIPYEKLVPFEVLIPAKPQLPMIPDTLKLPGEIKYKYYKVDTAKIIAEYIKLNKYKKVMFDNETEGKLIVGAEVQYNNLQNLSYTFTPMYKQTTITKQRIFTPFAGVSYNTLGFVGAGGGLYIKNVGIGAKYITDFNDKGYEFELNYKF